jgi:hypothetical protein
MTRRSQKDSERWTLDALLSLLNISPDQINEGERPDFMLAVFGQMIGVEVTMYQSGTTVGAGFGQRQAESEWESLQLASRKFRAAQGDISKVNVGLMFNDVAPARKEHLAFMEEIAEFIRGREDAITSESTAFWPHQFTLPLMTKYLRTLYLRTCDFAEWYTNITAGWVARPNSTLGDIVSGKATRTYRPSAELWLIVQCTYRISETVLPLGGVADLNAVPMQSGPFSKIYLLSLHGAFEWARSSGWKTLGPERKVEGPTFDELKGYLMNRELLDDPIGWRDREIQRVLEEIREGKIS